MPTQIGELGVTFPDNTVQTTAAIAGGAGFGGAPNVSIYSGSGVWICPPGIYRVRATVVGGGGGGADSSDQGANNGGLGGCAIGLYNVVPGTSYSVIVGGGGAGASSEETPGAGAGNSSFSSFCSATGGSGGTLGITPTTDGVGINGNLINSNTFIGYISRSFGKFIAVNGGSIGMSILTSKYSTNINGSSSPIFWTPSGQYMAGAAGSGGSIYDGNHASGGSAGAVMIEWWG